MKLTIPCFIKGQNGEVEQLMFKFGNARRRAYSMKQKGVDRLVILRELRKETGLLTRYVWTAYDLIRPLPPHVTFGGIELQRLRENGKISKEKYHQRRNNLLACLGQAWFKGNQCLRLERDKLRVTVAPHNWIHLPILIPQRYEGYRKYLDGSRAYMVLLRRRDDGSGYDVGITIEVDEPKTPEPNRIMALDINAGHIDFAVVEKQGLKPVTIGKVNCHELLSCKRGKNKLVVHKTVNKVRSIAKHYGAEVVAGKLHTHSIKSRKIQRMSQFKLRQVLRYKLPLNGVDFKERSEAYTSKVGRVLSTPMGLDVHKASAYAFAIKVTDYPTFMFLRGALSNEGDGILRQRLSAGSGLTALHQLGLVHDEGSTPEATPQFMGWGGGNPFRTTILQTGV